MVIEVIEMILLIMALFLIFPLSLRAMKILTELFLIFMAFIAASQNLSVNSVFLCLAILGNLFFVESVVASGEEVLNRGASGGVAKFALTTVIIVLIAIFSFHWWEEAIFPISSHVNSMLAGGIELFVIIFILMNLNKKVAKE